MCSGSGLAGLIGTLTIQSGRLGDPGLLSWTGLGHLGARAEHRSLQCCGMDLGGRLQGLQESVLNPQAACIFLPRLWQQCQASVGSHGICKLS